MHTYSQRSAVFVPLAKPTTLSLDISEVLAARSAVLQSPLKPLPRHVWIITGPSGCGKSTVGAFIAKSLGLPYIEGDEYHPQENIDKMSAGIPLNDEDRWGWLDTLREKSREEIEAGAAGCVVTCSALKRRYRDFVRQIGQNEENVVVRFVYLRADVELLIQRVKARQNHFFHDDMVRSQFAALEEPDSTEPDVVSVDVRDSLSLVQDTALELVQVNMKEASYF